MDLKGALKLVNRLLTVVFSLIAIVFVGIAFYPLLGEIIIPPLFEFSTVFGKEDLGYTLSPMVTDSNTAYTNPIDLIHWKRENSIIRTSQKGVDTRTQAIELLLNQYNSPLAPYASVFVQEADKNGNDWRLAVSISGVESGFGIIIPKDTYNGWGWRGGPAGDWSKFDSWEDGITHVTCRLAEGYGKNITPMQMESVYCPPCGATGLHYWARGVENYMYKLDYYQKELSKED